MGISFLFLDNAVKIGNIADAIFSTPRTQCALYLSLQGVGPPASGTVFLLTFIIAGPGRRDHLGMIDILNLGARAFDTYGSAGRTLREVLESPDIPKMFFDVRNDSAILHARYGITLQYACEVQLMENASRPADVPKLHLDSLSRCIERDSGLSSEEIARWKSMRSLRRPEEALAKGPLSAEAKDYAYSDVMYLPRLVGIYSRHLTGFWNSKIFEETRRRIRDSHSPGYQPQGEARETGQWQGLQQGPRQYRWCEDDLADDLERFTWGEGGSRGG